MRAPSRPRRSVLYMPASNARALEKAKALPADGLIFDLEDAVAPDAKETARAAAIRAIESRAYGQREILARANGAGTPWHEDDMRALSAAGPDGILIPKVRGGEDIRAAAASLEKYGAPPHTKLWAMIETPAAVLNAASIAAADPRLAGFVMGTSDLANDLRARYTADRAPLLTALSLSILAARAHDLVILDGVHGDIGDSEGFARQCAQSVEMGFDGRTLIHPDQVAIANEAFAPGLAEIARARRIVAAFAAASAEGRGIAVLDGEMIENLHAENARRILALAEMIERMETEHRGR